MWKKMCLALVIVLGVACVPGIARADGIIIPDVIICEVPPCPPFPPPPVHIDKLDIKYHHVTVTIKDQVATTHVDQVFHNPNDRALEGTYVFPLPVDAAVSNFTLWIDNEPVKGKVMDADEARRTYEDIVQRLRDPALLEYAGRGAVQARVFPIPPGGERRIELEYTQVLTADHGLVHYLYPLNTEKFSASPLDSVTVSVDIQSPQPLRAVYSPSHTVSVSKVDLNHSKVGYEASNVTPDTDFSLYYSVGETEAFHLLSYRDPTDKGGEDGFFLMLLAPKPQTDVKAVPKDVLLVLDRSGSMLGDKFTQAKAALRYILEHLNANDRFNVISFSTDVQSYAPGLRSTGDVAEALAWVDRLNAEGSTDINRALLEAAAMMEGERPTYLIFLTDGLPTEGETDSDKIIANFSGTASKELRLFAFGVGYDVDTLLLDTLAQNHHGATTYVHPDENIDEVLSGFYSKISSPVMTDLHLGFGDLAVYDMYPDPLPDLFVGSQVIVVGRYRGGGKTTVLLKGTVNGESETLSYADQVFDIDSRDSVSTMPALARLWATRKIGYLLNRVRLQGPDSETIDQIVKLSIRYGIVTPYTSYLVTEPLPLGVEEQERIAQDQYQQNLAMPPQAASGEGAVRQAEAQQKIAGAEAPSAPPAEASDQVRIAGDHTFVLREDVWIDTRYDPQTMQAIRVPFLSEDYFRLVKAAPDLASAFALGEHVIAVSGGKTYEVVSEDTPAKPVDLPTQAPAETPQVLPGETTPPPLSPTSESSSLGLSCGGVLLPALVILAIKFLRPL